MNDELPEIFERLRVPSAPAELRGRVLGAVDQELKRKRRPRWERVFELASAASLLIGIGLTAWQWNADEAWQRQLHEPQLAETGAERSRDRFDTSDPQLARLLRQRGYMVSRDQNSEQFSQRQARLLQEIAALGGG